MLGCRAKKCRRRTLTTALRYDTVLMRGRYPNRYETPQATRKTPAFRNHCSSRAFCGQEKLEDHMEQTAGVVSTERIEPTTSGVRWAAVIAGDGASGAC